MQPPATGSTGRRRWNDTSWGVHAVVGAVAGVVCTAAFSLVTLDHDVTRFAVGFLVGQALASLLLSRSTRFREQTPARILFAGLYCAVMPTILAFSLLGSAESRLHATLPAVLPAAAFAGAVIGLGITSLLPWRAAAPASTNPAGVPASTPAATRFDWPRSVLGLGLVGLVAAWVLQRKADSVQGGVDLFTNFRAILDNNPWNVAATVTLWLAVAMTSAGGLLVLHRARRGGQSAALA